MRYTFKQREFTREDGDLFSSVATVPQMESSGISSSVGEIRQTKETKRLTGSTRLGFIVPTFTAILL